MNIQSWFPFRLTGLISLLSNGLSEVFSSTTVRRHKFFSAPPSLPSFSNVPTFSHMPCATVCSSSTGFPLPPCLWPCISFPLPFSLCGSHCITWFPVVTNFTWVKKWNVFYLMIGNTILEHVLLLPGKHSQDWRIYLTSPFPYCGYLHFHLWGSLWG